ncbi:hypothetical protein GN958_ATG00065 [Phytophthora infestans]|uniref:DDE Tnp4 domain-containing protein n=1 Tax=Phytophthora infestans TaxID=4787 RepID=A0A8S9VGV0_PHYIN|nr:hypothetical protein GN958_ATG00065 [Phytophthora infestans]
MEMAFGLLVNKWRVFKAPPRVGVKSIKKVVHVACMLHNFCITESLWESHNEDVDDDAEMAATLASKPVPDIIDLTVEANDASAYRRMYASTQVYPEPTSESELLRNAYVDKLRQMKRLRPTYNIRRAERERSSELLYAEFINVHSDSSEVSTFSLNYTSSKKASSSFDSFMR